MDEEVLERQRRKAECLCLINLRGGFFWVFAAEVRGRYGGTER